jgi:RNA polymerase sigma factor (sigma-70 family)
MAPLLAQRKRADRAFEKLYQRHVGDVYRYALVVTRNPADAEDVTQTTFLNAYRAFARGERPRTAQNWLIAIAHNVCRQRFRQLQRRPNELPFDEETVEPAADEGSPTAEDIRRALGHLAFNQRAALVMRELEGRSYAEIAEVLQLSTSAVETLLFRARRALREQLEGSITCTEAELAISRQLDGRLPRKEKGPLRAHLRECEDCARFARSQRAQRSAIRSLVLIPVPSSLTSFFHHGAGATAGAGAAVGSGVAMKAAIVGASAIVATGVGVEAAHKAGFHPLRKHHAAAPAPRPTPQTQPPRARPASLAPPAPVAPVLAPPTPTPPHRQASPPKQAEHGLGAKAAAVARGRANAPGQLQAKPAKHAKHARPAKPTVSRGQAKKAARAEKPDKPKAQNAARPRRASVVKPKAARPAHPAVKPKPTHKAKAKAKAKPKLQPPPKPSPAPKADHSQKR